MIVFRPNIGTEQLRGKVVAVNRYASFKSMLESEGITNMLPGATDINEGVRIYTSFGSYAEDVKKYGCVAILFELNI